MKSAGFLAAIGLVSSVTAEYSLTSAWATCQYLKAVYPNITLLQSDSGYAAENQGTPILCPNDGDVADRM
jgi:hypothetical protein